MTDVFMGTETEYGITCPDNPVLSPIVTSTVAVVAYRELQELARTRWDFAEEHPLRDQRGFDLKRYHVAPVIDPDAVGVANVVPANGGRFYVDHAHPEYSSPECADAWEAMLYDAAGDELARQALRAVEAAWEADGGQVLVGHEPCPPLRLYKNNVDGKGASYGSHENYLYSRDVDFDVMAQALIPFFVCRQVVVGAGRVGLGADGAAPGFQISQRADYIETEISLETTLNRGIINTRDEPHAQADRFGRLHVIIGDANLSQTSTLLKLGMTSLVLRAIAAGVDFSDLQLKDPVAEVSRVSRDVTLQHRVALKDGRELRALDVLAEYRRRVALAAPAECGNAADDADRRVLEAWDEVAGLLEQGPLAAAHLLDWAAKYRLYSAYVARGVDPADPKLAAIDLQYCDIDESRSLYAALVRKGQMRQLVTADEIRDAALVPPRRSRAYLRGRVAARFGDAVVASSWQQVTLRVEVSGEGAAGPGVEAAVLHLDEVDTATTPACLEAIDVAATPRDLVEALARAGVRVEYRQI